MTPWDLSPNFVVREFYLTNFVGPQKILAENKSRVALHFTYVSGDIISISIRPGGTWEQGIPLSPGFTPTLRLTFEEDGPIVQQAIYAQAPTLANYTIIETCLIRDPCNGESGGNLQIFDPATGLP